MVARLRTKYQEEVRSQLKERFGYKNDMQIPILQKISVNMGMGKAVDTKGRIEAGIKDLSTITGQKAIVTIARKSISQFRLRQGVPIGARVTLRGERMYEFMDRLVNVVVPRFRDFRGLPNKLDGRGNYSFGLAEQVVFPEINLDKVQFVQGMSITFSTTARTDEEGAALLTLMGMPFVK